MKSMITFIAFASLSLQAMEQLENITVNLKNDKQISISPEQHKLLCRLSQTYADITQDTEKEVGTTQIITLNNIPQKSFHFIEEHLNELAQLGNPTPQNDGKKAFETLKTDFNEQSDHRRKSIKQIVTYLDLPKTNFPPYLHGGQIHENHCRDVKSIINQYIFTDHSEWPLITKIINDLITKTLKDHTGSVQCLKLSSDNSRLFSSSYKTIKIWNLSTHTCIATLKGHTDSVQCLTISPDNRLISVSYRTIKIWDLETHTCIDTLEGPTYPVSCPTISPDNRLISGSHDGTINIWDLETQTCIGTLEGHTDWIACLTLIPDNRLISGSYDIKIWDLETQTCIGTLKGHTYPVSCLTISPDNRLISVSYRTIKIWDLETQTCIGTLKGPTYTVECPTISPDNRLISGSHDGTIKIWDLETHTCIGTLEGHTDSVTYFIISPDNRLISSSHDHTIKIWDLKKFKEVKEKLNQLPIADVAILKIIQDTIKRSEWKLKTLPKKAEQLGASPALLELFGQQKTPTGNNNTSSPPEQLVASPALLKLIRHLKVPTKKDNRCCLIQ